MLRGNWREALGWGSPRATACWIVAIAVVAALLLAAPGQTVSARYLNDLMMFLDGAHRIVSGQVPHRDFHTPMGAVTNGLPAIGLWLTGSLGAAMPTGVGLLILALAPVMAYVLTSRLRPAFALPMAVYLSLILAAPANLGESPGALSLSALQGERCGRGAVRKTKTRDARTLPCTCTFRGSPESAAGALSFATPL